MAKKYEEEELRRMQRERRRKEIRRRRRQQVLFQRILLAGLAVAVFVVVLVLVMGRSGKEETGQKKSSTGDTVQESLETGGQESPAETGENEKPADSEKEEVPEAEDRSGSDKNEHSADTEEEQESEPVAASGKKTYHYEATEDTKQPGDDEIISSHVIFVDVEDGTILAGRDEKERIVPASMTKVLTLLVAVENIDDLDETYTITKDVAEYSLRHDCSSAGFEKEETVTIRDLLYGAILPSGADAALSLAIYVSGSQEAFVERMNEKLEELGLSGSAHFTNCVGIYEEDHYCTAYDLAVVMNAAIDNEICREVLSAHTYTTSRTGQHPEGILLSNWFLRRIEDKDTGGEVLCGKTGYVDQSGNCAVSYGVGGSGRTCICVTVNAYNKWKCINDHAALYKSLG